MGNLVVEAMAGVCVHDPQHSVPDPTDRRMLALVELSKGLVGASLSPAAGNDKIEFRSLETSANVEQTAAPEWDALPRRLQDLLIRNNLKPSNYEIQRFWTETRPYLRTAWAVALAKAAVVSGELAIPRYSIPATSKSQFLVIYLLDVSRSMESLIGNRPRIDVVAEALKSAVKKMIQRSTRSGEIASRYRIAMLSYSDEVKDLLGGIKTIDEIAKVGLPRFTVQASTQTARAFEEAEKLLKDELPSLHSCPAPLICHMTDGEYNGPDPEPVVRRIMQMAVPDGNFLVENIFVSDKILDQPIADSTTWPGILSNTPLANAYAVKLRSMSSPLPASYRGVMQEYGYGLQEGAVMLLPGMNPDLVELGFQMSAATPV